MDTALADKFDECANILETGGWVRGHIEISPTRPRFNSSFKTQGEGEDEYGMCAIGVLCHVSQEDDLTDVTYSLFLDMQRILTDHLKAEQDVHGTGIVHWNNNQAKDRYEVIDTFRTVAKDIRNGSVTT